MSTTCYISNWAYICKKLDKTPYELYRGRKPNLSHLHIFACKCFIHNNGKDNLGKLDPKSDEGIFLGYSNRSKAYRVYNKRTCVVVESVHVVFSKTESNKSLDDEYDTIHQNQTISKIPSILENSENVLENEPEKDCETSDHSQPRAWRYNKSHPIDQVIGDIVRDSDTQWKKLTLNFFESRTWIYQRHLNLVVKIIPFILRLVRSLGANQMSQLPLPVSTRMTPTRTMC